MSVMNILLNPASIAVIGASTDPAKLTGRPISYLQKAGFKGRIYPINPRADEVLGLKSYADPRNLPEAPDVGLVLVGANRVVDSVRALSEAGAKAAIVLASGFGESGEEGRRRQADLAEAAGGMRILGPNTIGLVNLTDGIPLTATGAMESEDFTSGAIALVSQSGGIMGSILSRAVARGIGFSKLIATGNESDLNVADAIDALAEDDATRVIALYLETIRDVDAFRAAAVKARAAGKRIVVYKVGRSDIGARSAVSHTGALAGADKVYDALFRQLGIVRATTFADLLDIPAALACGREMAGARVAVLTSTGGAATIVADNVGLTGLEMPVPDQTTAQRILSLDLKDAALDANPIDVTLAGLRPDLYREILAALTESPSYDAIVAVVGSSSIGQPDLVAEPLLEAMSHTDKPILAYVSPDAPEIVKHLNRRGIPAFAAPEACAAVLTAMVPAPKGKGAPARNVVSADTSDIRSGSLNEAEAKDLCARFGVPVTREAAAATPREAGEIAVTFGEPVVVKVLSSEILHKSELGGVAVGVAPEEVEACCTEMLARVRAANAGRVEGFLVQELVSGGTEMILGFNRDPQLGGYLLLGAGGVTTELYQDVAIRLLPIDRSEACEMIDSLRCAQLLKGFRGRPLGDIDALTDAILAFGDMAMALDGRLKEAEINPVFVLPQGQGVRAADGLVVLA